MKAKRKISYQIEPRYEDFTNDENLVIIYIELDDKSVMSKIVRKNPDKDEDLGSLPPINDKYGNPLFYVSSDMGTSFRKVISKMAELNEYKTDIIKKAILKLSQLNQYRITNYITLNFREKYPVFLDVERDICKKIWNFNVTRDFGTFIKGDKLDRYCRREYDNYSYDDKTKFLNSPNDVIIFNELISCRMVGLNKEESKVIISYARKQNLAEIGEEKFNELVEKVWGYLKCRTT